MFKLWGPSLAVAAALLPPATAHAAPLASRSGACIGGAPALKVVIAGFKARHGTLRVQTYGGDPAFFFEKGRFIDRIDVPVPATGPAVVCVPVARSGIYAVSVRHDMDGNRKTGRADGGGMSGNPDVSIADLLFRRKPAADRVSVRVGAGATTVPVTLNYIQGVSFRPISGAVER